MSYNCSVCGAPLPAYEEGAMFVKCEFDIVQGIYQTLLTEREEDPEIYWQSLLCKYGIEYVEDKQNHWIPTCHRVGYESILEDSDFKKVISNASHASKKIYERKATEIDLVQKKIFSVSKKIKPYDIFICYKNQGRHSV